MALAVCIHGIHEQIAISCISPIYMPCHDTDVNYSFCMLLPKKVIITSSNLVHALAPIFVRRETFIVPLSLSPFNAFSAQSSQNFSLPECQMKKSGILRRSSVSATLIYWHQCLIPATAIVLLLTTTSTTTAGYTAHVCSNPILAPP